jgi:hypothetical protein
MTPKTLAELAREWLKTPEGKEAIAQAKKDQEELLKRFKEARNIPQEELRKPMTI